ncbi:response regulator transcription factor [Paraburkholderia sediminicola]|uniref:response regulator n=1 Tax=Paraburkholderia sediminicola TaxID=458836 RepID=UPI0038B9610F
MKVLLVEDDAKLGQRLLKALREEGYRTDWVRNANEIVFSSKLGCYSIVLFDLNLRNGSGLDVLGNLRIKGCITPVLVISCADDIETRLQALDAGADDFLLKPFSMKELFARARVLLRRRSGAAFSLIGHGDVTLNLDTRELTFGGNTGRLSALEFALLMALLERPGAVLSRGQLESRLYGWGEEVESNAVDVLIHYVRKRFGRSLIKNVRGHGWTIVQNL